MKTEKMAYLSLETTDEHLKAKWVSENIYQVYVYLQILLC